MKLEKVGFYIGLGAVYLMSITFVTISHTIKNMNTRKGKS